MARLVFACGLMTLASLPVLHSTLHPLFTTGANVALAGGLILALFIAVIYERAPRLLLPVVGILVFTLAVSLVLGIAVPVWTGNSGNERLAIAAISIVVLAFVALVEIVALREASKRAEPELAHFGAAVWPHLRTMRPTVVGFAIAYFLAVLWFACLYLSLHLLAGPGAFAAVSDPSLGTFLYFSFLTITTLGYTQIAPISPLAQLAVTVEVIFGIAWTLIVFAALLLEVQTRPQQNASDVSNSAAPTSGELVALREEIRQLRLVVEESLRERERSPLRKALDLVLRARR